MRIRGVVERHGAARFVDRHRFRSTVGADHHIEHDPAFDAGRFRRIRRRRIRRQLLRQLIDGRPLFGLRRHAADRRRRRAPAAVRPSFVCACAVDSSRNVGLVSSAARCSGKSSNIGRDNSSGNMASSNFWACSLCRRLHLTLGLGQFLGLHLYRFSLRQGTHSHRFGRQLGRSLGGDRSLQSDRRAARLHANVGHENRRRRNHHAAVRPDAWRIRLSSEKREHA